MNDYKNLVECAEALIRRLETIQETNPEIHLKDDIESAKNYVNARYSRVLENIMATSEEAELPKGTQDCGHYIGKNKCTAGFYIGEWNSDELFKIADYVRFKKEPSTATHGK